MGLKLEKVLGYMHVELDGRTNQIRTQETNLGKSFNNTHFITVCKM